MGYRLQIGEHVAIDGSRMLLASGRRLGLESAEDLISCRHGWRVWFQHPIGFGGKGF